MVRQKIRRWKRKVKYYNWRTRLKFRFETKVKVVGTNKEHWRLTTLSRWSTSVPSREALLDELRLMELAITAEVTEVTVDVYRMVLPASFMKRLGANPWKHGTHGSLLRASNTDYFVCEPERVLKHV